MKQTLSVLIKKAIKKLQDHDRLPIYVHTDVQITEARDRKHGDYASNVALILCKQAEMKPRELAELIIEHLPESDLIHKVEIAGPGFINFFLTRDSMQNVVSSILQQGERFGHCDIGHNQRVHLEYVSANPTGPLHVGHGRGAAYGACVANLLKACGYQVHQEYYVNDAGRQMLILALSIWLRYLQTLGEKIDVPENGYQGEYVIDIARELIQEHDRKFHVTADAVNSRLPKTNDIEVYLDEYIKTAENLIGSDNFALIKAAGIDSILHDIQDDLREFGVHHDEWFRESKLFDEGLIDLGVKLLDEHGYLYEKGGAVWFSATKLGDEKDRVIIRENGQPTYFASDVAYHLYKFNEGYDHVVDVFGSDHHGYIARIKAFLKGLGKDPAKLKILLVQFAILYRGKEKVSMSTRKGQFVTLRELRAEVGNDAARFFYIMRKPDQHLDFDLELAKSQSSENPVYYIQYAHARICSVWRQLKESGTEWDKQEGCEYLDLLVTKHESILIAALIRYPEIIAKSGKQREPHLLAHYLHELANAFHTYYNASKFLVDDKTLRNARLSLISATQVVLANGLQLLGVHAPKKM